MAVANEWARIVNTTIRDYIKGWEDAVTRRRKLLNKIRENGGIKFNASGLGIDWKVRKARGLMQTNDGSQSVTFQAKNRANTAFLSYVGYLMSESMTKREKLMNRSTEAIVKTFAMTAETLTEDLEDNFAQEIYIDSAATNNGDRVSGIGTLFGTPTQTMSVAASTPTARTANVLDPIGTPLATYAQISTVLGGGGSWTGAWPTGTGDAEYDYWSPKIVNYTSSAFDGASVTWDNNCVLAIRHGLMAAAMNTTPSQGQCNFALFEAPLFQKFKNKKDATERVEINDGTKKREYGLPVGDSLYQDGCEITWEYGVPSNVGYGFNLSQIELFSMQDRLFMPDEVEYVTSARQWRWAVDFLGQFKFKSPRTFIKWMALA